MQYTALPTNETYTLAMDKYLSMAKIPDIKIGDIHLYREYANR